MNKTQKQLEERSRILKILRKYARDSRYWDCEIQDLILNGHSNMMKEIKDEK